MVEHSATLNGGNRNDLLQKALKSGRSLFPGEGTAGAKTQRQEHPWVNEQQEGDCGLSGPSEAEVGSCLCYAHLLIS